MSDKTASPPIFHPPNKQSDPIAVAYACHAGRLRQIALRRLGNIADAEDAVSDVFVVALTHREKQCSHEYPWLCATLRNIIGNVYKKRQRQKVILSKIEAQSDQVSDPFSSCEAAQDVTGLLHTLSPSDQRLLELVYLHDESLTTVSLQLHIPVSTVKIRLFRARNRLRLAVQKTQRDV